MKNNVILILLALTVSVSSLAYGEVKPAGIFGDHMVLQRQKKVRIWGEAVPGEQVSVSFHGQTATGQAGKDGTWSIELQPMEAGGPFELTILGKNKIVYKDVMVGEVWLCSGQSNMGFGVGSVENAKSEIASANFPNIRHFTKGYDYDDKPGNRIAGTWVVCSPATAGGFSAVAYFFARTLYKDMNVPIGLINSSWGATNAEQWISLAGYLSLKDLPSVKAYQKGLKDIKAAQAEYEKKAAEWEKNTFTSDPGNKGFAQGWAKADTAVTDWKAANLPQFWEGITGLNIDGAVWFRREVEIPPAWAGKDLKLNLGPIDDFDTTYFNNVQIGSTGKETTEWWKYPRQYTVPGKLVAAGRRVIAVRVFDRWKEGGFAGTKDQMTIFPAGKPYSSIGLAGSWLYKVEYQVATHPEIPLPSGPISPNTIYSPGAIYNGMIHPLNPFAIRGIAWYQGENNLYRWPEYRELLTGLVLDWRNQRHEKDLPFLIVQLPNFGTVVPEPADGNWTRIREAQLLTAEKLPNCGLAVTMDLGDARDVHCKNKQDVGYRLALAAEGLVYGKKITYSGPIYQSMKIDGDKIRLRFKHTDSGLIAKGGGPVKGFAIAGKDLKFFWADAVIQGDTVVVSSKLVNSPVAVRYAWADNPIFNLYNQAGLPAAPFRTDK
jgi:sialate O-acetylesterase